MQIYEELSRDHQLMRTLLERIDETSERAVKKRSELLRELSETIEAHARAEMAVFYRSLLDDDLSHDQAMDAVDDHKHAETALAELEELDPYDSSWAAKFQALRELLFRHFEDEEKRLFGRAKDIVSLEEAEEMGFAFHVLRTGAVEEAKLT